MGELCEQDVDECGQRPSVCQNGATCTNSIGGFSCICVNGWAGPDCSVNIDDCAGAACFNGATCIDRVGSFYCRCTPGKTGMSMSAALCNTNTIPVPSSAGNLLTSSGSAGFPRWTVLRGVSCKQTYVARAEVCTAVKIHVAVFRVTTLSSLVGTCQYAVQRCKQEHNHKHGTATNYSCIMAVFRQDINFA